MRVAWGLDENMETWKQKRLCVSRVTAMGRGGRGRGQHSRARIDYMNFIQIQKSIINGLFWVSLDIFKWMAENVWTEYSGCFLWYVGDQSGDMFMSNVIMTQHVKQRHDIISFQ